MTSEAVIVVLKDELGRFLMGKRSPENRIAPNVWTPISGTIESPETEAEAVVRECREELGIEVEPITKVHEMNASGDAYVLHWWTARIVGGVPTIKTNEIRELRWVSKDELIALQPTFREHVQLLRRL